MKVQQNTILLCIVKESDRQMRRIVKLFFVFVLRGRLHLRVTRVILRELLLLHHRLRRRGVRSRVRLRTGGVRLTGELRLNLACLTGMLWVGLTTELGCDLARRILGSVSLLWRERLSAHWLRTVLEFGGCEEIGVWYRCKPDLWSATRVLDRSGYEECDEVAEQDEPCQPRESLDGLVFVASRIINISYSVGTTDIASIHEMNGIR